MVRSLLVRSPPGHYSTFFFFNDTATTEIYTLSLHDALPISRPCSSNWRCWAFSLAPSISPRLDELTEGVMRSEEHTSELQSRQYLVCRLLLEKKKNFEWSTQLFGNKVPGTPRGREMCNNCKL